MPTPRLIIGTVLPALVLVLGLGPSAFGAKYDLQEILHLKDVTIPWRFPEGLSTEMCANRDVGLINPVDNASDRVRKITSEVKEDGGQVIVQDDPTRGIAADGSGNTYQFIYKNLAVFTVSPNRESVDVHMKDSFRLQGKGLHASHGFDWTWTYEPPNGVNLRLDPTADFPVDSDPFENIVTFVPLKTEGDPINCDPL